MHVIRDVCVIPMEGDARLPHHDVVVDGSDVVALRPTGQAPPEHATVVDGSGRFLTPGLIDTHCHFWEAERFARYGLDVAQLNDAWLDLCLLNGVTTILCLHGFPEVLALRERVAAGELDGPTIHTSGPILDDPDLTYESALVEVAREAEAGYEFVKVYNRLTKDAYRGIDDAAPAHGLRVLGHVPRDPGLNGVLASNQVSIVHAEEILYTAFDFRVGGGARDWLRNSPLRVADLPRISAAIAEAGITMMPCVSAFYAIWQQSENPDWWLRGFPEFSLLPQAVIDTWTQPGHDNYVERFADSTSRRNLMEGWWFQMQLIDALHDAGVPMTAGTDFRIPGTSPGLLHVELSALSVAGLGDAGALRAATAVGGEFLEPGARLGLVAPGSRADLVLLAADPLLDVRNAQRIDGVMARGRWHSRADLDARRTRLAALSAAA
jgi:hypothetical protein